MWINIQKIWFTRLWSSSSGINTRLHIWDANFVTPSAGFKLLHSFDIYGNTTCTETTWPTKLWIISFINWVILPLCKSRGNISTWCMTCQDFPLDNLWWHKQASWPSGLGGWTLCRRCCYRCHSGMSSSPTEETTKNVQCKFDFSNIVGNFSDLSMLTSSSLYQFDPMEQCSE